MSSEATDLLPRLTSGEVQVVWFGTDLPDQAVRRLELVLSPDELIRADRFHFARDRERHVVARGQLRVLLGHHLGQPPDRLEFTTGRYGKPELRQAGGAGRLRFNLSHSDGTGLVAMGLDEELGVDVERIRPLADSLAIAQRHFARDEYLALSALPERAQLEAFFRFWTCKEAVVKSLGQGLSHPLDAIVLANQGRSAECAELECEGIRTVRLVLPLPTLREGCVAALATSGQLPVVHSSFWPGE